MDRSVCLRQTLLRLETVLCFKPLPVAPLVAWCQVVFAYTEWIPARRGHSAALHGLLNNTGVLHTAGSRRGRRPRYRFALLQVSGSVPPVQWWPRRFVLSLMAMLLSDSIAACRSIEGSSWRYVQACQAERRVTTAKPWTPSC